MRQHPVVDTLDAIDKAAAPVANALEAAISKIPGVAGLERVHANEDHTQVIWGFTCNGVPSSLTWNKTP